MTEQKKRLLKAKIAVALHNELGRVSKEEEVENVFLLARVMYKAVLGPTFRSFSRRDNRFFRRVALKGLRSADGGAEDARRGRMRWREWTHGATQCLQNIERPNASSGVLSACALDREWFAASQPSGTVAEIRLSDRSAGTAP